MQQVSVTPKEEKGGYLRKPGCYDALYAVITL